MGVAKAGQVTLEDIRRAEGEAGRAVHETPLLGARSLGEMVGSTLLLKAENLQRTGSFKIRGAINKLASLSPTERRHGVMAASAGNHAQGVALAAREAGIPCAIVMPRHASITKVEATRGYGAEVILHGATFDEAQAHARRLAEEGGMALVPAFDDPAVIAGQGVVGLELCRQAGELDLVVVPVGGGGLIAGVATAVKALRPATRVVGVQVEAAPAAARSFAAGRRVTVRPGPTLADGIAVGRPGRLTLPVMRRLVDQMVTVSDGDVAWATTLLLERAKLLVEGAGAVGLAALLSRRVSAPGQTVAVVLSGGNVDPLQLGKVLDHGLARQGRFLRMEFRLPDVPGSLSGLLEVLARSEANVLEVAHHRRGRGIPVGEAEVEIVVETSGAEHAASLVRDLHAAGYGPVTH